MNSIAAPAERALFTGIVKPNDVGMSDGKHRLHGADESFLLLVASCQIRRQHLDGRGTILDGVGRPKHHAGMPHRDDFVESKIAELLSNELFQVWDISGSGGRRVLHSSRQSRFILGGFQHITKLRISNRDHVAGRKTLRRHPFFANECAAGAAIVVDPGALFVYLDSAMNATQSWIIDFCIAGLAPADQKRLAALKAKRSAGVRTGNDDNFLCHG